MNTEQYIFFGAILVVFVFDLIERIKIRKQLVASHKVMIDEYQRRREELIARSNDSERKSRYE